MRNEQHGKTKMARTTLECVSSETHQALLADIPAAQEAISAATDLVQRILACGRKQKERSGEAQGKAAARETMLATTFTLCSGLKTLASNTGNATLAAQADWSRSALERGKEADVVSRCESLLALATENAAELAAKCKILAKDLKAADTAIKSFKAAQPKPRQRVAAGAAATRELPDLFGELDEVLLKQLDPIVEMFRETEPAFYNEYRVARAIVSDATAREGEATGGEVPKAA